MGVDGFPRWAQRIIGAASPSHRSQCCLCRPRVRIALHGVISAVLAPTASKYRFAISEDVYGSANARREE